MSSDVGLMVPLALRAAAPHGTRRVLYNGRMSTPLIVTKLYLPPPRAGSLSRPRLIERLGAGLHRRLTLICAPAGSGKSTLVSQWLAACGRPAAWLALDEGEGDPAQLLAYLIAAIQRAAPGVGAGLMALLRSPQPPPPATILAALINELSALPQPIILALDDYHRVGSRAADEALTFLIDHMPPQLHLVVATRERPRLALARLRARDQLTELRAAELRFTPAEAAAFLSQSMGLALSDEGVAAIEARTEGWAAGLQLAALSLQGQSDPAGAIRSLTGGSQFVLDYLIEEVLQQQPEATQQFLMRTSILGRMCGPLCDALLGDPAAAGHEMLAALERASLFIVPLDHERRWYRYHHLFADVLRQRLAQRTPPGDLAALHARASDWLEGQGLTLEAFQHATLADDHARAERLIEGRGMPLHYQGALAPVLAWLEAQPTEALDARPALWVVYASAVTMAGHPVSSVEQKLAAAEAALRGAAGGRTRDLLGQIAATRAMLAIPRGQAATMEAESRRALELLRPDSLPARAAATWTLGLALQIQGDRDAAARAYADAIATSQATGNTMITIAATTCMGQLYEAGGQLDHAAESYQRTITLAGEPPLPAACEAYLGMARVCYARGDLAAAEGHGQRSAELAAQIATTDTPISCRVLLARVRHAQGDLRGAAALLAQAERFARSHRFEQRLPEIAAAQALLRQGAQRPPPLADPLSQREIEVLRLISQGLSNREIGDRLVLALDTVKGHNRRIYEKLQVQRRTEAVARARELGLLNSGAATG